MLIQSLKGFNKLKNKFGPFLVTEGMFHITEDNKVKVWLSELAFDVSWPENRLNGNDEHFMIKNIFEVI